MTEADKPAFIAALNEFGVTYGKTITPAMANIYWKYLNHMPRDGFEFAVQHIHRHGKQYGKAFPEISDFTRGEGSRWT